MKMKTFVTVPYMLFACTFQTIALNSETQKHNHKNWNRA